MAKQYCWTFFSVPFQQPYRTRKWARDLQLQLPCGKYWVGQKVCVVFSGLKRCLDLSAINFSWPAQLCGASSSKKSPAPDFGDHFWHIKSVTGLSPYAAQIFFLHFICVFTFLGIIKPNMLKILLIFFLKMATQKSLILISFLNVYWYDSCHNTI